MTVARGNGGLKSGYNCGWGLWFEIGFKLSQRIGPFYGGGKARWLSFLMKMEEVGDWALVDLVGFDCDN